MPNTLTSIFVSNPATEPVEAPHPNTGVYVTGTQAVAGGPWTVVHTLITKTTTPLTMVGRLKNFPTVTVSVVATGGPNAGNIFNNVPAAPMGTSATGTATGISVTASTSPNGLINRILASSAAGGPFVQVYQGGTSSYPHPLAAGTTQYYQYQYVGSGYYDDSPPSAVFSATATAAGSRVKALFFQDDSLGAYYYAADGTWTHPGTKVTGAPTPQQFAGKLAALVQGGVPVFNNSYPGFGIVDAGTNGPAPSYSGYNVVADANTIFAANTAYDIDMVVGFLENGFDSHTLAQIKTAWDSYNTMYLGMGAKRIFHRVPVQRTGAYSNTLDGTYSANMLSMRTYMRSQAAASGGTIIIANDADGPNITAQGYPANVQYCNQNDVSNGTPLQVHFTEYGVTEQANEIRLLLAANGYAFSGPAVSVGTGGVTFPATGNFVAYTLGGGATQNATAHSITANTTSSWGSIGLGTLLASGNCFVELTAPIPSVNGGFIFGLTISGAAAVNYTDIAYGFYLDSAGGWGAIENGAFKAGSAFTTATPNLTGTNTIRVSRTTSTVSYLINNVVQYTSTVASSGVLRPKVTLNGSGVTLTNLQLTADSTAAG